MSANFTPEQIRIQGIAADCRAEGFTGLADALEKIAAQPSLDEIAAHVGLSSDFDGGGGFSGWHDAGETASITAELLRRGYDADAIAALWSGNFLRLLRRAEQVAD